MPVLNVIFDDNWEHDMLVASKKEEERLRGESINWRKYLLFKCLEPAQFAEFERRERAREEVKRRVLAEAHDTISKIRPEG